jgi:hypothetical protein
MIWSERVGALVAGLVAVAGVGVAGRSCGGNAITTCASDSDCSLGRSCIQGSCQVGTAMGAGGGIGGKGGFGGFGGAGVDAGTGVGGSSGAMIQSWYVQPMGARDVDILMMIDNSRSMLPLQQKLLANFPVFMQVLESLPQGLPNLHLAVVSSDMGAGVNQVELCNDDQGIFQSMSRGTCVASGLLPGQNFISNVNGVANYTGALEDVFSCIAALGQDGCGFEAQLHSVVRALGADGFNPPVENAGFLRSDALLAIVLLTNEDDCSVPADSDLFDTSSRLVSDPLGPLQSFRCNEYGHLCNGAPPSRTMASSFGPGACVPAEEQGQLIPVHTLVEQVKSLKADPTQIVVAAIAGLPDPYSVSLTAPLIAQDPSMWPQVDHSCMESTGEYADPGVRLSSFVKAFGDNGLYLTVCAPSFAPALQVVANKIGTVMGHQCLQGSFVLDQSGRPTCSVVQESVSSNGGTVSTPIPSCSTTAGAGPCWNLTADATSCADGLLFSMQAGPGVGDGGLLMISCSVTN